MCKHRTNTRCLTLCSSGLPPPDLLDAFCPLPYTRPVCHKTIFNKTTDFTKGFHEWQLCYCCWRLVTTEPESAYLFMRCCVLNRTFYVRPPLLRSLRYTKILIFLSCHPDWLGTQFMRSMVELCSLISNNTKLKLTGPRPNHCHQVQLHRSRLLWLPRQLVHQHHLGLAP